MELEQTLNIQPDSLLMESIESLQTALSGQTTLIYVLIAIAVLSLIVAFAAVRRSRSAMAGGIASAVPAAAAPLSNPSASNDAAVVAAITAAISCVLAKEKGSPINADQSSGFIVRRIRRV